jgi:hypothetical protein
MACVWIKGGILPQSMDAQGHEIIHLVVRLGNAGEDAGNATLLLGLRNRLVTKVRRLSLR